MAATEYLNKSNTYRIGPDLALVEITGNEDCGKAPISNIHSVFFIFKGSLTIELGGEKRSYCANQILNILPSHSFCVTATSDDILAFQILYTDAFVKEVFKKGPPFPMEYVRRLMIEPGMSLTDEQMRLFERNLKGIRAIFKEREHYFFKEKVKCALLMLLIDIGDITYKLFQSSANKQESDTRKILFMRFMEMLDRSVKEHRSVAYFADQLHVSSQYLERVVKSLSKRGVKKWIQHSLVTQVNERLLATNDTIQQIAADFGFVDQQTFSKYYRRIMGIPPSEHRSKTPF